MDKSLKELLLSIAEDSGGGGGGGGNAFGKIKVGATIIEADSSQDILELAASGKVSLIPDTTNDKVTIVSSGSDQNVWFGTSSTTAGTAAKTVSVDGTFALTSGNIVFVHFSSGNTVASPTLNVNSTGAVAIYKTSSAVAAYDWSAGEVIAFVYDGTYWRMTDGAYATTSYYGATKLSSSTSSTSTSLAATPSAVKAAYDLANGKSAVTVTQTVSAGTKIGTINIDGTDTDLYAPNGGGGDHEELTQAEYDALTPEEKNNGTVYYVPEGISETTLIDDPSPIGSIQAYGGSTAPTGWLMCDGSAVSRSTYAMLFSVIGTTYGEGDGSTTFNLPDLAGKVAVGSGTDYALGSSGGKDKVTLAAAIGCVNSNAYGLGYIQEGYTTYQSTHGATYALAGSAVTPSGWNHSTPVVETTSSDRTVTNMQPYVVTNYIIKAEDVSTFQQVHPVGSYFETSDSEFNPNNEWGGTWEVSTVVDDYIVDEGTDGIWNYRKWNSGIAECWGTWAGTLSHYGTQFGGYAYYTSVYFPSNFFIFSPLVTYSGQIDSSFCLTGSQLTDNKDYTNCYGISGASGSQTVLFKLDCKGRWKNDTAPTVYKWHRTA